MQSLSSEPFNIREGEEKANYSSVCRHIECPSMFKKANGLYFKTLGNFLCMILTMKVNIMCLQLFANLDCLENKF